MWIVAVLLAWPFGVQAQQAPAPPPPWGATLDASDGHVVIDGYSASQIATVAPHIWATTRLGGTTQLSGDADGMLSRFASGHLAGYAEGGAAIVFDTATPIRTTWSIAGGTGAYRGQLSSTYVNSGVRVERADVMSVGAMSLGGWGMAALGQVGTPHVTYGTKHAGIGVGLRWYALTTAFSADRTNAKDLISTNDIAYTDFTGRIGWHSADGIQVEFTRGSRTGTNGVGRRWAELSGVFPLTGWSALAVSGGAVPLAPERGTLGAKYTTVAVRLMFGAAAHRLPLPGFSTGTGALVVSNVQTDGSRTLWLTLPGSRTVELMGDFTDWRPIAMTLAPDGRWYARMVLGPGAHRVNVRVDGDTWHAPPGLPVVPDDFGGVVGVLVIR